MSDTNITRTDDTITVTVGDVTTEIDLSTIKDLKKGEAKVKTENNITIYAFREGDVTEAVVIGKQGENVYVKVEGDKITLEVKNKRVTLERGEETTKPLDQETIDENISKVKSKVANINNDGVGNLNPQLDINDEAINVFAQMGIDYRPNSDFISSPPPGQGQGTGQSRDV